MEARFYQPIRVSANSCRTGFGSSTPHPGGNHKADEPRDKTSVQSEPVSAPTSPEPGFWWITRLCKRFISPVAAWLQGPVPLLDRAYISTLQQETPREQQKQLQRVVNEMAARWGFGSNEIPTVALESGRFSGGYEMLENRLYINPAMLMPQTIGHEMCHAAIKLKILKLALHHPDEFARAVQKGILAQVGATGDMKIPGGQTVQRLALPQGVVEPIRRFLAQTINPLDALDAEDPVITREQADAWLSRHQEAFEKLGQAIREQSQLEAAQVEALLGQLPEYLGNEYRRMHYLIANTRNVAGKRAENATLDTGPVSAIEKQRGLVWAEALASQYDAANSTDVMQYKAGPEEVSAMKKGGVEALRSLWKSSSKVRELWRGRPIAGKSYDMQPKSFRREIKQATNWDFAYFLREATGERIS